MCHQKFTDLNLINTMTSFDVLSAEEKGQLTDSIAYITVLIAGADGKIDREETDWAKKLTEIRGYNTPEKLRPFYTTVGETFATKLDSLIDSLPTDVKDRNSLIEGKLANLNSILSKMDNADAATLYESLTSFAKHVAKISGGFLGFFSISKEEAKLIDLPMINKIELIVEEEE